MLYNELISIIETISNKKSTLKSTVFNSKLQVCVYKNINIYINIILI